MYSVLQVRMCGLGPMIATRDYPVCLVLQQALLDPLPGVLMGEGSQAKDCKHCPNLFRSARTPGKEIVVGESLDQVQRSTICANYPCTRGSLPALSSGRSLAMSFFCQRPRRSHNFDLDSEIFESERIVRRDFRVFIVVVIAYSR